MTKLKQLLSDNVKIIKTFTVTLCLLCPPLVYAATDLVQDPDFAIELQQNTECSFITGDNVNIRSGPGTQYSVVTQLNRGDGVRAQYREGNWVKLAARTYGTVPNERFEPLDGWIINQYINGCSEDQFDRWRAANSGANPEANPEITTALALDSEGLRLINAATGSTKPLAFGMKQDDVVTILTNLRGKPRNQGVNPECGAGALTFAQWDDGLTLWFSEDQFAGWIVDDRSSGAKNLTTMSGIGGGSTRADLEESLTVEVQESSLGTEFSAGSFGGLLSGSQQDAQVTNLWGGTTCIFR
ncbi:MAG: SH3 domain-containing protein [Microcoleaceae cyanobacterium]